MLILKSSTAARLMAEAARLRADGGALSKTESIKRQFALHAELARTYARCRYEMNSAIAAAKDLLQSDDSARALCAGPIPISSEVFGNFINELQEVSEKLDDSHAKLRRRVERRINELLPGTFDVGSGSDEAVGATDDADADEAAYNTVTSAADTLLALGGLAGLFGGLPGLYIGGFVGGAGAGMHASVLLHRLMN